MKQHVPGETSGHPLWLLAGFWFCVTIAIGVVLRRLVELIRPSQSSFRQMASLDAIFSSHAVLTATHVIPAAVFVLLCAAVLLRPIAVNGRSGSSFSSERLLAQPPTR